MSVIDIALIVFIFGEFFLLLVVANYLVRRREKHKKTETKDFPFYEGFGQKASWLLQSIPTIWKYLPLPLGLKSKKTKKV